MRNLITTIALLALAGTSVAIAQTPPSTSLDKQLLLADAPVGLRQPCADLVPSEKHLMDPKGILILKGLTLPPAGNGRLAPPVRSRCNHDSLTKTHDRIHHLTFRSIALTSLVDPFLSSRKCVHWASVFWRWAS